MKKLSKFISWRNLGIIRYNAIWQNLASLFYIGFTEDLFSGMFLVRVVAFGAFSTFMTGYGYLVNDLADIELDRKHGKPNVFQGVSLLQAITIIVAILLVGGLFSYPFWDRPQFWAVWILWILTATFYSLPPLRLKERSGWGLITTIMAQQTFPTALIFAAFGNLLSLGAIGFVFLATSRGTSSDVSHQMRDYDNDARTDTKTFAVRRGYHSTQKLYAASLEIERLTLGVILTIIYLGIFRNSLVVFSPLYLGVFTVPVSTLAIIAMWLLILIYLGLLAFTIGRSSQAYKADILADHDPYNEKRQANQRDALHIIHHTLPSVILPAYMALLATLIYWPNIIFIVALFLLYGLYSPQRWLSFLPSAKRQNLS